MLRTKYMQDLMTATYSQIPIIAILEGFDGAWEKAIARKLELDYVFHKPEAVQLMKDMVNVPCVGNYLDVAYKITKSTPAENIGTLQLTAEDENEAMEEILSGKTNI